jgi:hypothetical protein
MGNKVALQDQVICYSGYKYAQRPSEIIYVGERIKVNQIETEWNSPSGMMFIVNTRDGRKFRCNYDEFEDCWQVFPA